MLKQKPFKRAGRMPIRRTLVSVQVNYYNGEPEDRVRLCELCNGKIMLSGWPRAGIGEERPREKSFVLDDATAQLRKCGIKVVHAFTVQLDHGQVQPHVEQKLGEHTHSRTHFKHRQMPEVIQRMGDALGNRQIRQEMLPQ